jgi:hypothetical protein
MGLLFWVALVNGAVRLTGVCVLFYLGRRGNPPRAGAGQRTRPGAAGLTAPLARPMLGLCEAGPEPNDPNAHLDAIQLLARR